MGIRIKSIRDIDTFPDLRQIKNDIHQEGRGSKVFHIHEDSCPALKRRKISWAGITLATDQYQIMRCAMDMNVIKVCLRGVGEVWTRGKWHRVTPGMAFATPARHFQAFRGVKGHPWDFAWIIYREKESETEPFWENLTELTFFHVDPRPWEYILQGLYHEVFSGQSSDLAEHWVELLHSYTKRLLFTNQHTRLWALWQAVQANLEHHWTLPDLEKKSGFRQENLRRICQSELGISPMQQVTHLRMQHAIALLASGNKMTTVAEAVGYDNPFAFSNAFRRTIGQPPSKFQIHRTRK